MAGTRSSARLSSSPQDTKDSAGTKRKADEQTSPSGNKAKRGRPSKDQKTLEETIAPADTENDDTTKDESTEMTDAPPESKLRHQHMFSMR